METIQIFIHMWKDKETLVYQYGILLTHEKGKGIPFLYNMDELQNNYANEKD